MNKKIIIAAALILIIAILLSAARHRTSQNQDTNYTYTGPHGNISKAKIAVLYEKVTDRTLNGGRSLQDTANTLNSTRADLIFRGFWIWNVPVPESPDNIPPEIVDLAAERLNIRPDQVPELIRESGMSYMELGTTVSAIKKEIPGVIFVGAIPAQTVGRIDRNPITGKILNTEDTWAMALDPQKWINYTYNGKPLTKEAFQEAMAGRNQETFGNGYDHNKANGYFPDITNPDFQELSLSWAKKQIDEGADAIWIDMLYSQSRLFYGATNDTSNPAVRESYDAASKLVDDIHRYGESKGRYIYVGTWSEPAIYYPYAPAKLDFVTTTPTPEEVQYGKFDEARWDKINAGIKNKFGNIPHFAFIDWGGSPNRPMDVFSQQLSQKQQSDWLKNADSFFRGKGIVFVYPVHGGDFWGDAKVRAFGKFTKYDSLAPEFDTYGTIRALANGKAGTR